MRQRSGPASTTASAAGHTGRTFRQFRTGSSQHVASLSPGIKKYVRLSWTDAQGGTTPILLGARKAGASRGNQKQTGLVTPRLKRNARGGKEAEVLQRQNSQRSNEVPREEELH